MSEIFAGCFQKNAVFFRIKFKFQEEVIPTSMQSSISETVLSR